MSRNLKNVSFGTKDEDIINYLDTLDIKFSTYVKRLIRQDMTKSTQAQNSEQSQTSDLKELVKTLNKMLETGLINVGGTGTANGTGTPDSNKPDAYNNDAEKEEAITKVDDTPKVTNAQTSAILGLLGRK